MSSEQQEGAELQQILAQVSELQERRLQSQQHIRLLDVGKEEEQEEAAPPCRSLPQLCSIPRRLVISPGLGGAPVTPQLTESLRRILFGGTFHVFNYEWRKSVFQFRESDSEFSYALETDRGGTRPIQMVVQARVIKHLLFVRQSSSEGRTLQSLCVGPRDQERALAVALSDSLWLAGQEVSATVTLVTEDYCITPHLDYKLDNFTERLQLFTFNNKDDVRKFIFDRIQCFTDEGSHGVILFLYSLICSRTVDRLKEDLDSTTSHLLYLSLGNFVCRQALLNLLLTGRASPNVFNGTVNFGEDGRPLEHPLQGVMSRSDVGYLHWSREQMERGRLPPVGSMLKTPRFPVWLCSINNSHSVLFSVNRSLLSDWKMEHLFHLFYYNGQTNQTTRLTVDTHSHHWEASSSHSDPEKRFPSLEMTIRTKWDGAAIDWNSTVPFY
ncbi:inactive ubiquitin carboxyl-terminal hydrolase MINDY-4B isoform X1 [Sparus aurata]|uniref:inactive ubiquitin carboxyl-terminal hydrolase MINDY-4B isoform X1 n=1 Tax=Sparus aurata TaxID=8175 RepID=UPI0011C12FD2|nr:inactive ubiquitin carboxyl-terminal hydrolase MINDY-4B isoform X1 [Sparus aurata]XP_030263119.1 inactive ubiquitin carboxyl-terminal hydrolase MINDY-4B isoform X1 [Sparus aurata]XP_030263129.1 inactive ubiquitin carboxyl-terminal hydrolase MINDY-4B isoform X1 [Sparus aurata]